MKKALNQELMRTINKKRILDCIRNNAPISKKAIANQLETSITSVSTVINELLAENIINNCGSSKSTGGRRSELFQLNPTASYFIGVDIQVNCLFFVLLNLQGEIVTSKNVCFTDNKADSVVALINQEIKALIGKSGLTLSNVNGIGIGVPGIINNEQRLIEFAPNLGWKDVDLCQMLQLDIPITIENEANAAALGEKIFGSARSSDNIIYISIGTGVGTGLVFGNRIFGGINYHAGEFGHMTIDPDGPACECGNNGCWEVYISNPAVLKRFQTISNAKLNSYDEFIELFENKNTTAVRVMEEVSEYMSIGIANLVNGLNPEMIIIGGAISAVGDLIIANLLPKIERRCLTKSYTGLKVEFSKLKEQATALGVAGIAVNRFFEQYN
ncbi:MAG TPA: ROK family transcriptional regulator [Bacillota bacterium]|jgi:predicted NBD/HSP70 family sugar kinase|nr:ROK family transcriptional regulator [Bacillota bacterium]HOL09387.1 ROK family transcriptional regulator [Bacillota bacterium]HPO97111.1 ROK family transcriptional regulator [Bacillota bacterium]